MFHVASVASLVIGVAIFVMVFKMPIDVGADGLLAPVSSRAKDSGGVERIKISLADFGSSLEKPLQRPLQDPKPDKPVAKVEKPKAAPPRLDVQVVGTAVASDTSESRAWIKLLGGEQRMIGVGDELSFLPGDPAVRLIEEGRVVFSFDGRDVVVGIRQPD